MNYTKIVKNFTKFQITLIALEIFLIALNMYLITNPNSSLIPFQNFIRVITVIFGCLLIYSSYKYNELSKYLNKYKTMIRLIDNIVKITAINYFYAYKMKRKFDINKINSLNKSEYQFVYVPDMLDIESEATEDEIKASIDCMKDWNISVIHLMLTRSIESGYISNTARKFLIDYGVNAINDISKESFVHERNEGKNEIYTINLYTPNYIQR